ASTSTVVVAGLSHVEGSLDFSGAGAGVGAGVDDRGGFWSSSWLANTGNAGAIRIAATTVSNAAPAAHRDVQSADSARTDTRRRMRVMSEPPLAARTACAASSRSSSNRVSARAY